MDPKAAIWRARFPQNPEEFSMPELVDMAEEVRRRLFPQRQGPFAPQSSWSDLGGMLEALEGQGLYLMTNSVADPKVRRMASFHRATPKGYPCVGMSGWGSYETVGGAILCAAFEALTRPLA